MLPKRKNIRLRDYDYSQNGCYFVTICTHERRKLFGEVVGDGLCAVPNMQLTVLGNEIRANLLKLQQIYNDITICPFVIMPNHIHFVAELMGRHRDLPLQNIVGQFKSYTTKRFNDLNNAKGNKLWQRGYYDHIIRNEKDYQKIQEYIETNPQKWQLDQYYQESESANF